MNLLKRNAQDLTPREKEIQKYVLLGFCYKQIAERLSISKNTVDTHRRHIHAKVRMQEELARAINYAIFSNSKNTHL
jgi:DNA-binding CsgD family transcriptional regulator